MRRRSAWLLGLVSWAGVAAWSGCAAGGSDDGAGEDAGNVAQHDATIPDGSKSPDSSADSSTSLGDGSRRDASLDATGDAAVPDTGEMDAHPDADEGQDSGQPEDAAADAADSGPHDGGTDASMEEAGLTCTSPSQCPPTGNECLVAVCPTGTCATSPVAAGTPTSSQTAGDCHTNECDGAGNIVSVIDDTDVPTTTNACTIAVCTNGTHSNPPVPAGAPCSQSGGILCDGQGGCSQTFTVVHVGTGLAPLASTATAAFLETYYPIAGASPVSTVALPTAASGSNQALVLSGTATSEGGLSRSADGHSVAMAGYNATLGAATTGTERVVGRLDSGGSVDTSTVLTANAFSGSNVRGAASADGTAFWVSGTSSGTTNGGVWYVALGAAGGGTQILTTPNNMRMVNLFDGQLYGDSASGAFTSVLTIGSGLPTSAGQTATSLPGMVETSPYGFVLLNAGGGPSPDTLYVADSSVGLVRWTFNGATWAEDTTFTALTSGCLGVAGWLNGNGATLIVTTAAGAIDRVDVPTSGSPTLRPLVTAATNTAYRGAALAAH